MSTPILPRIPAMNELLAKGEQLGLATHGREALRLVISAQLDGFRRACLAGQQRALDDSFWAQVEASLEVVAAMEMGPALNGTGVVMHTNLGRAPWAAEAVAAAAAVATYGVVEIDRESGERGRRDRTVSRLLGELCGTEAGLPLNNNAAAVLLMLSALARGRKVVVARNELIEIGGSYRMHEVIAAAGAEMIEVGTTNRVHLDDYVQALDDPQVACVLRAHPSNFEIKGFTSVVDMAELAQLCHQHVVPLCYDLGSGVINGAELTGVKGEPTIATALKDGCDLVSFSGDKLLGGPQAGLVVGAQALIEKLRRDMLTRCLRLDKTMLAGLEATLRLHALGEDAACQRIPVLRMLALTADELKARAEELLPQWQQLYPDYQVELVACEGRVGSGASPLTPLPGWGLALSSKDCSAEQLALELRQQEPPIFARIQDAKVVIDVRTLY
ncbi:MAG: L-seryl-tRNA(Sec) selenium transferase [Planctomycetota bacterium]|nr:MAG: L-seryl-tRNA(Sec) selenium transferase [Planctomycetota bacterium]